MRARRWEGVGAAVVQAACGEDVTGEWVARAREERTENMSDM